MARSHRGKTKNFFSHRAIEQLRSCRPIPEIQVRELCYKARELLIEEGNVVLVDAPVTVSLFFLVVVRGMGERWR